MHTTIEKLPLLVFIFAAAHFVAWKTEPVAFTSTPAFCFKFTFCQFSTALCDWWKFCPNNLPHITMLLPAPLSGAFSHHVTQRCLSPYAACLICCTVYVLTESCASWRNRTIRSLHTCKHVKSDTVNIRYLTGPFIHSDDKSFKNPLVVVTDVEWVLTQFFKHIWHFLENVPCLPCYSVKDRRGAYIVSIFQLAFFIIQAGCYHC